VGRVTMNGQGASLDRFPVYAPAALAAIGTLPDTILDRAVVVHLRRRAPDEPVRAYRQRVTPPEGGALRDRLAGWAADVAERVGEPWPDMPVGVDDRPADVWEPLLMVADLWGAGWPVAARAACAALVGAASDESASPGVRLLADLRGVFGDAGALPTETILGKLRGLDEAPWGDWYGKPLAPRDLARLLKPYGAAPRRVRVDGATPGARGYTRADLLDAWTRYLPRESATSATSATALARGVALVADVADAPCGPKP
jgi:Protein of unknown function (DUF3631)